MLLGLAVALVTALLLRYGMHAHWMVASLAALNISTFALYAYDKNAARDGWGRVPELLLHLAALCGGSPAAFLAQRWLRHKTVKQPFQLTFRIIVAAQVLALVAWAYLHFAR